MILHVVLIRPKQDVAPEDVERLSAALAALPTLIPGITDYRWGPNASPEGKGQGYELGFVMTFASAAARDAYLPHPEHQQVGPFVAAVAADVLVFDIEA